MRRSRILMAVMVSIGLLTAPTAALASGGTPPPPTTPAALSTVRLSVTDVVGGTPVVGTITLTSKAPTGGLSVTLSSDDTVAATVPAGVTVPAGSTTATFPVTTFPVTTSQSTLIIAGAGSVTTYTILTVYTQFAFTHGSISIIPGNNGNGTITSTPAGISCRVGAAVGGTCNAFFPVGTVVRLTARAAAGSSFQGWRGLPGCGDPSRITVARNATISCQPAFSLN